MVLILDGSSEYGAQAWSELGNSMCLSIFVYIDSIVKFEIIFQQRPNFLRKCNVAWATIQYKYFELVFLYLVAPWLRFGGRGILITLRLMILMDSSF